MAEFPAGTFSPRAKENFAGASYDPDNKKVLFVEDIQAVENEIIAIEDFTLRDSSSTPATTGTMTLPMDSRIKTITPTGNCTFNASGGVAGQLLTILVLTSGTTSRTLTFGTNFIKQGTLATGTVTAKYFAITFLCIDGTKWVEVKRTTAMS